MECCVLLMGCLGATCAAVGAPNGGVVGGCVWEATGRRAWWGMGRCVLLMGCLAGETCAAAATPAYWSLVVWQSSRWVAIDEFAGVLWRECAGVRFLGCFFWVTAVEHLHTQVVRAVAATLGLMWHFGGTRNMLWRLQQNTPLGQVCCGGLCWRHNCEQELPFLPTLAATRGSVPQHWGRGGGSGLVSQGRQGRCLVWFA